MLYNFHDQKRVKGTLSGLATIRRRNLFLSHAKQGPQGASYETRQWARRK